MVRSSQATPRASQLSWQAPRLHASMATRREMSQRPRTTGPRSSAGMTTRGSEVSAWVKADTRDSKDIRCGWKPWVTLLKSTNYLCRRSTLITSTNCRIIPFIYRPPGKNEQTLLAHKTSTHVVHASANFACSNKLYLLCHNTSTKIESRKLLVPP